MVKEMIRSRLKTIGWYIKQPKYYTHLFLLLKRIIFPNKKENSAKESIEWCENKNISTDMFLSKIFNEEYIEFKNLFNELYISGEKLTDNIPVKMGGPGNLTLLYYLTKSMEATKVVETGVAYGWSSLAILKAMNENGKGRLISTDMPYAKMNNEKYVGLVVPEALKDRWKIIRLPDVSALPIAIDEFDEIDLCHYDSDKSYSGRMWAYPRLWKALRSGGYLVSDDIGDNVAFKEFAENVGVEPFIVKMPNQYVGVLVKK